MKTRFPQLEERLDLSFRPIENASPKFFTRAQIEHYNLHGYISNVPVFTPEELARTVKYFDENRGNFGNPTGEFAPHHHDLKGLYDFVRNPRGLDYLSDLIGPNIICHVSQFVPRDPGGVGSGVPWHHDASYNSMDARSIVVWTALRDAFVDNGCMWFIPGSHLRGAVDCDIPGGHVVHNPLDYGKPVPIEVKAGHAVFMSDLLLHNSNVNHTKDKPRDAFTSTYCAAELTPHLDADQWSILCRGVDAKGQWRLRTPPTKG